MDKQKISIIVFSIIISISFISSVLVFSQSTNKSPAKIIEDSPFGFHTSAIIPPFEYGISNPFDYATDIGVKWERPSFYFIWTVIQPNLKNNLFNWERNDRLIRELPESMMAMGNIAIGNPRRDMNYNDYAQDQRSFIPKDIEAYKRFVKAVVERYDGDGINDMLGLKNPIKYWQVDNEPPHGMSDYAQLLRITYFAIKEADPNAKVIIGGVPGMPPVSDYLNNFNRFYLPILEDLAKSKEKYFDIFDFHWYGDATGDYRGVKGVFNYIKNKIDILGLTPPDGYWITEMGTYSGDPGSSGPMANFIDFPYQSEKQQSIDLLKRYVYPLLLGIKKIFMAFGLKEGFKYDERYFDFTGFIYDGKYAHDQGKGVKKLGYYTYKKITETLEGSDWNNIKTIQEKDGIYIYKFTRNGKSIWVAWNDNAESKEIEISDIYSARVKISEAVPRYELGKDVKDYNTACNEETKTVNSGKISVTLEDTPVFIEER